MEYEHPIGRFVPVGSIITRVHNEGRIGLASAYYKVGLVWEAKDWLSVEVQHGSWHPIDRGGPTEVFNRAGVRARLSK